MAEDFLSYEEEIRITRGQVAKTQTKPLLIVGWCAFAIGMLIVALWYGTGDPHYQYLWLVFPVVAILLTAVMCRRQKIEKTSLYRSLTLISRLEAAIIAILAICALLLDMDTYWMILCTMSLMCGLTGYLLKLPDIWRAAIGGLAMMAAVIVTKDSPAEAATFTFGVVATMVVPGYILLRESKKITA